MSLSKRTCRNTKVLNILNKQCKNCFYCQERRTKRKDTLTTFHTRETFHSSCTLPWGKEARGGCFLPVCWLANQETYQCRTDDVSKRCYRTTHSPAEDMKWLGWDSTAKKIRIKLLLCEYIRLSIRSTNVRALALHQCSRPFSISAGARMPFSFAV